MKRIYMFGEGTAEQKNLLGGKGANLSQMKKMGVPVPAGFTVTTEMCNAYYENGGKNSPELIADIKEYVERLEKETGKAFGDAENPLLVSVRSGARVSMPGMMDTILNLGMNKTVLQGMIEKTGNARFVWDSYRRLIQMFGEVVREVEYKAFDDILEGVKEKKGYELDVEMTAEDWQEVSEGFLAVYEKEIGEPFPEDPMEQLYQAVDAVFRSWDTPRARVTGFTIRLTIPLERRLTCKQWPLGIPVKTPERASYLPVTQKPVNAKFLVNFYSMHKVKTSLREFVHPSHSMNSAIKNLIYTKNSLTS